MPPLPPSSPLPLRPDTARRLDALLADLDAAEAAWIAAYLAGFAAGRAPPSPAIAGPADPAPSSPSAAAPLTILFGSQTGHGAALARLIEARAQARGLLVECLDMAGVEARALPGRRHLLVVVSTHGDGAPPDPARDLVETLLGRRAPKLPDTTFAVLALGDSSYRQFCKTGRDLDSRLEALGATRLRPRFDGDVDYARTAPAWIEATLDAFAQRLGAAAPASVPAQATPHAPNAVTADAPFAARLLDRVRLTGRGSDKVVVHVELSLEGSGIAYAPGDALGVQPRNDPALVDELIAALRLDPDAPVDEASGPVSLRDSLTRHREITVVTPRFLTSYSAAAKSRKLAGLLKPDQAEALARMLDGRQVADIVREFPAKSVAPQDFAAMLRGLAPRLYSLASSPLAMPDEAHLTVGRVEFGPEERPRFGVASGWLADRLGEEDPVPVHLAANPRFHLPDDPATPIVMIGAGTGVAPFRAFLQHRAAQGNAGPSWLFFGERRFRTDFLYQVEWQAWLKSGVLGRMDVAFSRDQRLKVYVQHRLLEHARALHAWIEDGAIVYLCGDARAFAPGVEAALLRILAEQGGKTPDAAAETLARLEREGRFRKDVYG